MSRKPKAPKPKVEYRLRCADETHRSHRYGRPTREKAEKAAVQNNDPATIYGQPVEDFIGSHKTCAPWRVEARVISPWENVEEAEELAAMLVADWWDWGGDVPPELPFVPGVVLTEER